MTEGKPLSMDTDETLLGNPRVLLKEVVPFLVAAVVIGIVYAYAQSQPSFLAIISDVASPFFALIALVPSLFVVIKHWAHRNDRWPKMWSYFALGLLLWFMAETIWAVYTLWLNVPLPYPSVADAFWLAGYVFWGYGLITVLWPFRDSALKRNFVAIDVMLVVLGVVIVAILVPPILENSEGLLTTAVDLAYPLLDVLLLAVTVPACLLFWKGTFWKPLLFILCGIVLVFAGDILFDLATLQGVYYEGHPLELFYHWAYLSFSAGCYIQLRRGV